MDRNSRDYFDFTHLHQLLIESVDFSINSASPTQATLDADFSSFYNSDSENPIPENEIKKLQKDEENIHEIDFMEAIETIDDALEIAIQNNDDFPVGVYYREKESTEWTHLEIPPLYEKHKKTLDTLVEDNFDEYVEKYRALGEEREQAVTDVATKLIDALEESSPDDAVLHDRIVYEKIATVQLLDMSIVAQEDRDDENAEEKLQRMLQTSLNINPRLASNFVSQASHKGLLSSEKEAEN